MRYVHVRRLVLGAANIDDRIRAARIGGAFWVAGSVVTALVALRGPAANTPGRILVAIAAAIAGVGTPRLPWRRLPRCAPALYAVLGIILLAFAASPYVRAPEVFVALIPLSFTYIGITQPPGSCLLLLPWAIAWFAASAFPHANPSLVLTFWILLPILLFIGELMAAAAARQRRMDRGLRRLLDAARRLLAVRTEEDIAAIASLAYGDLLGAGDVGLWLVADADSRHFKPAGGDASGHDPWLPESAAFVEALRRRLPVTDASPGAQRLFIPLPGAESPVGVAVCQWNRPRAEMEDFAERAVELLSSDVGRAVERVRNVQRAERQATTDALTGLPNRRALDVALGALGPGDTVALIDLDHFKAVNDRDGHLAGDQVLRALAACLRQGARAGDCVARYGGEEFAIVLSAMPLEEARAIVGRLHARWVVSRPATTFSAGLAEAEPDEAAKDVLARADEALYEAKRLGRNRIAASAARQAATGPSSG
jgi:diguanylate cyclase (GGDEF)-like protein